MKLAPLTLSATKYFIPWRLPPPPHRNLSFNLVSTKSSITSHRATRAAVSLRTSAIPARDRVIDFGKYKGRMLGSLPSAYLRWVSKNLRAGDTEEWAKLADRVLNDPVYRDRLEWEAAEKILSGDAASSSSSGSGRSAVAELLEISERYGWDNDDKSGWSKIDFGLLGTSKGGRIPRVAARPDNIAGVGSSRVEEKIQSEDGKRGERRERVRRLREKKTGKGREGEAEDKSSSPPAGAVAAGSPFPGREALLRKALNRQRL